ncbi:MAG: hypothetical protein RL226_1620 [Bacteroidota bacterium]|jgi:hypothetical protein
MTKLSVFSFFLIVMNVTAAQTSSYDIQEKNRDVKVSLSDILGNWQTADSAALAISFVKVNDYYVDIHGINHGAGNYLFRVYGDSISVNGTAPNWPPYDCTLRLLKRNHLEIEFHQFNSNSTTRVVYRR